jgi:hypothetical protein
MVRRGRSDALDRLQSLPVATIMTKKRATPTRYVVAVEHDFKFQTRQPKDHF